MKMADAILEAVLAASFYGAILAGVVLLLQAVVGRRISAGFRFALWFLVLVRLSAFPLPESRWSVFNWLSHEGTAVVAGAGSPEGGALNIPSPHEGAGPDPAFSFSPGFHEGDPKILQNPGDGVQDPKLNQNPVPPIVASGSMPEFVRIGSSSPLAPAGRAWWWKLLVAVYFGGVGVMLVRQVLATAALRRLLRQARPATDPALLAILDGARATLRIRRRLPVLLTEQLRSGESITRANDSAPGTGLSTDPWHPSTVVDSPFLSSPALAGVFAPRLLLPAHLVARLTAEDLRFIFLHECAHLRRRDVLINHWLALLAAVHWFNPVVWFLMPRIRADRELAADELVLRQTSTTAAYGHTLLKLLDTRQAGGDFGGRGSDFGAAASAVSILESRASLRRRIRMIADFRRTSWWFAVPAFCGAVVLAAATLTTAVAAPGVTPAVAQPLPAARSSRAPAGTQAAEPSADELLKREIVKWKAVRQSITGDSADDKLARDELDKMLAHLEKYVGAPAETEQERMALMAPDTAPGGSNANGEKYKKESPAQINEEQRGANLVFNRTHSAISLHLDNKPFEEALREIQRKTYDSIANSYGVYMLIPSDPRPFIVTSYHSRTIHIDPKVLASAGIQPDTRVSFDSDQIMPIDAIKQLLLKYMKQGSRVIVYPDGIYNPAEGHVDSRSGLNVQITYPVNYNVRDLLKPVYSNRAGGMSVAGNPDDLIHEIRASCSPAWWQKLSKESDILQFKGLLTVTTLPEVHEQIQTLLTSLRQADAADAIGAPRHVAPEIAPATRPAVDHPAFQSEGNKVETPATRPAAHANESGEIYVGGAVNHASVFAMTPGHPLTLKQVVLAAGINANLASAKVEVTLTRREGESKVETFKPSLGGLLHGSEPDYFLEPNDIVDVKFPFQTQFKVGYWQFLSDDKITITEIRGTADSVAAGNTYQIKGTYTLASQAHAKLAVYVTAADPHDTHHDPYDSRQTVLIDKGSGSFTVVLPMLSKGYPHLSFYAENGGQSFSTLYFGSGETLFKETKLPPEELKAPVTAPAGDASGLKG